MTKNTVVVFFLSAGLAACGGGGSSKSPKTTLPADPVVSAAPKPSPSPTPAPVPVVREAWACTVVLPTVLNHLVVHFEQKGAAWSGSAEVMGTQIPPLELTAITHEADHLVFTLTLPNQPPNIFDLVRTADSAVGTLMIGPSPFHAKMRRLADGEEPKPVIVRMHPHAPYPYAERELTFDAPEDGKLAGTLTIPTGTGPFPAVLLVSGSGQQDRDENIYGHKPFRILADRLTRAGLVVLRVDDRGAGKSQGPLKSIETDTTDARAAFELLLKQPEVDPKRVGVIGHSIGGSIAPVLAVRTKKVAFIVSLAGTAVTGLVLVPLQIEADLTAKGAPPEIVAKMVEFQRRMGAAAVKGDVANLRKVTAAVINETLALGGQPPLAGAELEALIDTKVKEVADPWSMTFFKTDPAVAWRKVKVPVLVVIGSKDTQVPPKANFAAVTAALKKAGNKDVTTREVPGLNHLFQHADLGISEEYGAIEESFDPQTLEDVTAWLVARAHLKP